MSDQSKWEELQQSWQAAPNQPLPKLAKLMKRRSWILWIMTAGDALGSIAMMAIALWVLGHQPSDMETEVAVLILVGMVVVWASVLVIRRGTWRLQAAAPAEMLDLMIRRCRTSIMLATMTQYAMVFGVVYALVSRFLFDNGRLELPIDPSARTVLKIAAALLLLAVPAGAQWHKHRKRAELERLKSLRSELELDLD